MRETKLKSIVEKTNSWLKGRNYRFDLILVKEGKYKADLYQGSHHYKTEYFNAVYLDGHFAKIISKFILDVLERDFYECVFGKIIRVRLDIISLDEHPEEYLKRHKFNILNSTPEPIADCWILEIIDEGLPLTDKMTLL